MLLYSGYSCVCIDPVQETIMSQCDEIARIAHEINGMVKNIKSNKNVHGIARNATSIAAAANNLKETVAGL